MDGAEKNGEGDPGDLSQAAAVRVMEGSMEWVCVPSLTPCDTVGGCRLRLHQIRGTWKGDTQASRPAGRLVSF